MYILFLASLHSIFIILVTACFKRRIALYLSTIIALWIAVAFGSAKYMITDLIAVGAGFWLANSLVQNKPLKVNNFVATALTWSFAAFAIIAYYYFTSERFDDSGVSRTSNPVHSHQERHIDHKPMSLNATKPTLKAPVKLKAVEGTKNKVNEKTKCFELASDADSLSCLNEDQANF